VDGLAPAGALTPAAAPLLTRASAPGSAGAFDVGVATPADDVVIRRLLRESAFGESVSLSLEREPDSRLAGSIEGDLHETIVARERRSGAVAGIAARAVRDVFVNGGVSRVGYLGQLRIDPRFRTRRALLDAGFEFCRRSQGSLLHLASVVADNAPARRLLSRKTAGWPRFDALDTLVTLAIPSKRRLSKGMPAGVELQRGSRERLGEIVDCLQRNGRRYQFFPRWKSEHFDSPRTRGLTPADFTLAIRGGQVIGCVACWDQRAFKQAVVRGYSGTLGRWRPILNALGPLVRMPRLPPAGNALQFSYLSHVAVDDDDEPTLIALVDAACVRARASGLEYIALGLPARSAALGAVTRAFAHRRYESLLYAVCWPEGEALVASLDGRPANPELALL
jgi:hypothetical protein